jgi:zinc protease
MSIVRSVRPRLVAAALTLFAASMTSGAAIDPETLRVKHEKFVLPNGLTVLVHEDHSVPVVAVNVWYHVGSRDERRGRTGFAHMFEHFFFNGSTNYPHGFREAMDDLGATNRNGTTSTDRTNFFEDVPVGALERTLYLEADRMGFLAGNLSQEMLERERGVVSNEKRQGENQPYGRVFTRVVETVYPASHPYSWSTIGSLEDLQAATIDDVKRWYETYYGPNNAVLSLAGDITVARARELVTRYFGAIPPGPALPKLEEWIPKMERDVHDTMQDRVPQTRVYRVWHAPRWGARDLGRLNILANVLSGSKSGRLDRRLIYDKGIATTVGTFVWDREIASSVFVQVTLKPGVDAAAAEKEIDAVVAELLDKGPTADEVERAKTRILAEYARGLERLGGFGGRSDVLAESATFGGGDPHAYVDQWKALAAETPATVASAGRDWLRQPSYHLTVEPFPQIAAATTDAAKVDRSVLPSLGGASDPSFPAVQEARLANGLRVMLLERHSAPLVRAVLAADAGSASDTAAAAGVASLALGLMDDGTASAAGKRDAFAIEDRLDSLGASISTETALDLSFVRLDALAATFGDALDVFADVVRNPSFPTDLVELEKKRRLAQITQEKAQPVGAALRLAPPLIYGEGHPYAKPFSGNGTADAVGAVGREQLVAWHRTWLQPGSSTLIVTGDVKLADLLPRLEKAFGSWPAGKAPAKDLAQVPSRAAVGKVYLIDKKEAPQSVIVAAHLTVPGGQADDLAIEVAMRNFGGMATSRLNRNLRLDKHWSYGTSGQVIDARGPRPMVVLAPVQTDKTKEAILEVKKELADIAGARPIRGEEFDNLLRGTVSRLPGRFETLEALEGAAIDLVHLGYPETYFAEYAAKARALTDGDLAKAAGRAVKPGDVTWIVIGDLSKVEAGIRELNLGPIVRLDADGKVLP